MVIGVPSWYKRDWRQSVPTQSRKREYSRKHPELFYPTKEVLWAAYERNASGVPPRELYTPQATDVPKSGRGQSYAAFSRGTPHLAL